MYIPEAHPECYRWMLERLREELQIDLATELTTVHKRVLGEFLVGDENFRTIFVYYDRPTSDFSGAQRKKSGSARRQTSTIGFGGDDVEENDDAAGGGNAGRSLKEKGGAGGAASIHFDDGLTNEEERGQDRPSPKKSTRKSFMKSGGGGEGNGEDSPLTGGASGKESSAFRGSVGNGTSGGKPAAPLVLPPRLYVLTTVSFTSYPREKFDGVSNDLLYFIRIEPEKALIPENMDTAILWGTCRGQNVLDSFLRTMRFAMVPTLLRNKWPTSIEKDVQTALHRFMATMVEDIHRLKGRTSLYIPNDLSFVLRDRPDAHTDRELVQRYEATVIHWTRQIKEVVGERDNAMTSSMEDGGPLEEIRYWRSRARDLGNIRAQLNCPDVSAIVGVLREAKSLYYLEPFLNLRSDIEKGTEEAFDNLRFLSTLVEPCEKLAVATPKEIPEVIPDLLLHAQLILLYSKNYKKDQFSRFLFLVSNEIIRRCSMEIDVSAILSGDVEKSMVALEESVAAGEYWISECKKCIAATNRRFRFEKGEKLDLDDSFLNEIDGFVRHRCQNLQEICRGQLQFGFKGFQQEDGPAGASTRSSRQQSRNRVSFGFGGREEIVAGAKLVVREIDAHVMTPLGELFVGKLPFFSGNKGPEIESQLLDIQRAFKAKMEVLRHLDYDILDVKATKWVDDFRALKVDIDNLTMMLQQIITASLDSIATVSTGAEYMEAFYLVSKSEELLIQLNRSKDRLFRLFTSNLKHVQGEIQRYFDRKPPVFYLHPPSAGRGFWANNLASLITDDYNYLRHCYYLPDSPDKDEALTLYDQLDRSLREKSHQEYMQWRSRVPVKAAEYLDRFLLTKRLNTGKGVHNPPLLDVNFSHELLLLFEEVRFWTALGEPIPTHIIDICAKEERLRVFQESVALVARAYNAVVNSLTKTELQLFAIRLQFLYSKYAPGLNKLWWNSQGIVEYFVKECRLQAAKVQQVVDDYKYSTVYIDHHCRVLQETLVIVFEKKRIYTVEGFLERQTVHREAIIAKLTKVHSQIVRKMFELWTHFREDYGSDEQVRRDWHNFVERIELKVEEALKIMVKRSLHTLEKALPLESSEDRLDEKIFKLDVIISVSSDSKPEILPMPSVMTLAHQVNDTCKAILGVVHGLPRVEEALKEMVTSQDRADLVALEEGGAAISASPAPLVPVEYNAPPEGTSALRGTYLEYLTAEQEALLSLRRIHIAMECIADKVRDRLTETWQVHQSSTTDNLWTIEKQDRRIKQGWKLEDYRINMDHVAERREGIDKQDLFSDVVFIQLDFTKMKDTFRNQCQYVISYYHRLLYEEARNELNHLYDEFQNTLVSLTKEPKNLDQLGEQLVHCTEAVRELPKIESSFAPLSEKFGLITSEQYNLGDIVDPMDVQRCEGLPEAFEEYTEDLGEARKLLERYKEQFRLDVETDLRALLSNSFALSQQIRDEAPTKWTLSTPVALSQLGIFEARAAALRATELSLQQGIKIFKIEPPKLDDLLHADEQLKLLRTIWELVEEWRKMTKRWKKMFFMKLESERIVEGIETVRREVIRLRRELERTDVWIQLREDIDLMKKIIPIIDDLRTPAIRPRHWESLKVQIDAEFDIDSPEFCLETLLEAHMEQQADFIANLAVSAREELKIETDLEKIAKFWEDTAFEIEPYQGYQKIASVEEVNAVLAEHLALLSSMKMSRFVDNFSVKVLQWEQTLSVVTDTIEGLLTVQTKWMYLENIFIGSEDINRKLVLESKKFDSIHAQWLTIMSRLATDPNVIRSTRRDTLLEQLNAMNSDLEMIQKSLEGFLEERRRVFPRFYFLSNDDLLEILGHTKEPEKVQPHFRKCFEGLYHLSMKTVRNRMVADAMSSADGEVVPYTPAVQMEGVSVEVWLRRVEDKMRETVQKFILDSLQDFQDTVFDSRRPINRDHLKAWVERHEGQALITSSCINWTKQAEIAIVEYGDLHASGLSLQRRKQSPIYKIYKKWKNMIKKYCQMVRQPQSRLQRNKLVALVTIEVHSRDILRHILANRVHQLDDFEWSRQLRFYSESDATTDAPSDALKICIVRQTSAVVRYDYEYLGNSGRLVVTGLTDRAYMTLTTALQLFRGGLPQGPAGTGKTETVKDLGKAIGKYVMVFNCSDGLDYKSVGRMLSGIAQTGAWSCFDEFNRIEVEVLSVVAQQILSILTAVSEHRQTFLFEGSEIPLNVNCGLFVTMNPGYAGRSELPDNLKALLRPISMMIPDFTLICEITLLSEGFEESENLSKKVSILYELMEKQLSKQDHYDFSLRNIKAVLVQAGNLKRENFPGTESQLCLKAMKDMNLPKFVKEDVPLFLGMLGDLFPGVEPEESGLEDLRSAAREELTNDGLEANAHVMSKCLHLWDTLCTRHGVMVVGRTGSGKTVTWRTLAGALKRLKEAEVAGPYEQVKVSLLNPKSVTMEELYGSYNQATREWKDGILSDLMRQICRDATDPHYKWLLFDGPVDTLWIESMNTVLDDNKMLTLNSGERISMNPTVRMLFEVQDLSQASPATVSRCGMVYFNYEDLGWKPYAMTWLKSRRNFEIALNAPKPDTTIAELEDFMMKTLADILHYKETECAELVPTTSLNAVRSFTKMFDSLANADAAPVIPGGQKYQTSQAGDNYIPQVKMMAMFCAVWAAGGSLTVQSRQRLDSFVRELDSSFPSMETVFGYFPELSSLRWKSWDEHPDLQKPFTPPEGTPYYKQIVPTIDTIRYPYLVGELVKNRMQLVLVGTTGTGKSLVATQVLKQLSTEMYMSTELHFSAQTSAKNVQDIIEGRMEHKNKKVCSPPGGRRMVCLIEDLNMPSKEKFGAQPPLELLRQWLDNGYWYDRSSRARRFVNDMQLLCCLTYGRPDISERLMSKLNVFNITFPSENVVTKIFSSILENRFDAFTDLKPYVDALVKSTTETYQKVSTDLLPIPSKSHYLFNLRDLSKVFQGIYSCYLESLTCKEHLAALWVHECQRVFADRMNDPGDKAWFRTLLNEKLNNIFQTKWSNIIKARSKEAKAQPTSDNESPIFIDFWDGEFDEMAKYKLVPSMEGLRLKVEEGLENYNTEPGARGMNLVFFTDALEHLCRIHRIIRQPRGNALLIGLGGSGRASLTRLATYLAGYSIFTIEIHKKYDSDRFHDDLRTLYRACGVKRQQKVFYFCDNQIMEASFLEDLNNMLSSGEVPNLFPKDDLSQIRDDVHKLALLHGCRDTADELYNFFVDQARQHLHLVVAMSPAQKEFRSRLRQFPALVSCTSIDWFSEWPNDALREVGYRYLEETRETDESDEKLHSICDMFVLMHDTTSQRSLQMQEQIHRYNYVTPSSYLDLVRGYRNMLTQKRDVIVSRRDKLSNGMSKLEETKLTVGQMTEELKIQDAKLQEKTAEVELATDSIHVRQRIAEEQQSLVASEKIKIEQTKRAALADQAEASADLERAMPGLLEAQAALDSLRKEDINEMKSYKTPAPMIRKVMEAVQVCLHRKLEWDEAKKSLSEPKFLENLKEYHVTNDMTDQKLLNALEKYVRQTEFKPKNAEKVSKAAGGLCQWVIAIFNYGNIYKEVYPKILKNENAEKKVRAQEEMLRQKEERLAKLVEEVRQLEADLQANINEKNRLEEEARKTQDKLNRARIIVDGLEGERGRWTDQIENFEFALGSLSGDTLMACGYMCYAGAFTTDYRQMLWQSWMKEVKRLQIQLSKGFGFVSFLADPTEIRDWQLAGLPGDEFSCENGVIVMNGPRYPLMIDPQLQAIKWIKKMEKDNGLKVVDMKNADFQKTVEYAVQFGCPLLLQDILEEIDPILDTLMSKAVVYRGSRSMIKIGDNYIDYNEKFRLYITTRMANPHYTPEACTKVCLLNFSVKEQGLEEQLLKIVVEREKPELERDNEQLILNTAAAKKETKLLEDEILNLLSTSQGSLLENTRLIQTLQSAKVTAANIKEQLREAEFTSEKISSAREQYRECAKRASILFFVLADLGSIDAMYQFALDSYIVLFQASIKRSSEKIVSHTLEERVKCLNDWHTAAVYTNTCRGLFEHHKLLFSFHMTIRILQAEGRVNLEEYVFLIRGGQVMDKQGRLPNPASSWLSERAWDHILELEKLTNFHGITTHFESSADSWRAWFLRERPEEYDLPDEWHTRCSGNYLQKMIFIRSLRPDRVIFMVYEFIETQLGSLFVEPPQFNLKDTFDESTNTIPLIFVLSAGVDPTTQLAALAQRERRTLKTLALGQGQGDNAKRAIQECSQTGGWVFLANCHLMVSWLVELEKIIDDLADQNPHREFRLWLSSVPTPQFPIGILQRAIKMTTEPPKGIKANMLRLYNSLSEEDFAQRSLQHPQIYRNLLFSLCFFHSVLLERRKFGTLGYNVIYDFTMSDFEVSENIIELYINHMHSNRVEDIPFVTIRYLIAEASYGGRVTDDWDRRVLNTYMSQFMCPAAVTGDRFALSSAAEYYIPNEAYTVQAFKQECYELPVTDPPEAFGQHANADIASRISESTSLLDNLILVNSTLFRGGGGSGSGVKQASQEDRCMDILASLDEPSKSAVPGLIDYDAIYEATNEERMNALNTCLLQEVQRYNILLKKIQQQKMELRRAVKGQIVMSDELETIFDALLLGRVPPPWTSAYPSMKPLASWSVDLVERIDQMKAWGQRMPTVFWLAGFTYPTGFLKSLQQQQARTDQISIDQYTWDFVIMPNSTMVNRPRKGAYIRGIFLEGAGWDMDTSTLCEPNPMELIVHMPIIHFKPQLRTGKAKPPTIYECPLYMYMVRTGTRERPSYVLPVDLECGEAVPEHYTKRGTALLLSTND